MAQLCHILQGLGSKKNMKETGDGEMSSRNTSSGPDTPTILMNSLQLWLAIQDPQKTEPSTCPRRQRGAQEAQLDPDELTAANSYWGKGCHFFFHVATTKFSLFQEIYQPYLGKNFNQTQRASHKKKTQNQEDTLSENRGRGMGGKWRLKMAKFHHINI